MGVLGNWVVLNETTDVRKRYYLRFDRTTWTEEGELTERWWKQVHEFPRGRFAEDARAFSQEEHKTEKTDRPYSGATPLAAWSPDWGRRYVFDGQIPEDVRAYIDPQ